MSDDDDDDDEGSSIDGNSSIDRQYKSVYFRNSPRSSPLVRSSLSEIGSESSPTLLRRKRQDPIPKFSISVEDNGSGFQQSKGIYVTNQMMHENKCPAVSR